MNEKTQKIYGGFTRLRDFPLDSTSIYEEYDDLVKYMVFNKTAYEGQLCIVKNGRFAGVYQLEKDENSGNLVNVKLAYDSDVIKNAEDIATLFVDLRDKHAQIEVNKDNIAALTERVETDYVTNVKLNDEIKKILGDEYESLSENLNDIAEISAKLSELIDDLQTKIDSNQVMAKFQEYELTFSNIAADIATLNAKESADISAAKGRLDVIEGQLADLFPRILDDEDVLRIVDERGLYNVLKIREFAISANSSVDTGFLFKPGDVIKSLALTVTTAVNSSEDMVELTPYIRNTDNSSGEDYIISDGVICIEKQNRTDRYVVENINYSVLKEGNFAFELPTSFLSGRCTVRVEYFRKN